MGGNSGISYVTAASHGTQNKSTPPKWNKLSHNITTVKSKLGHLKEKKKTKMKNRII